MDKAEIKDILKNAQQRAFERKIIQFVDRTKVIRSVVIDLLQVGDYSIAISASSAFTDFRDAYREFKHIIDKLEYDRNFDHSYAKTIHESSKSLHTQFKDIMKTSDESYKLVPVLRSIKEHLDKMIIMLDPEMERLMKTLDEMREAFGDCNDKMEQLKTKNRLLEKEIERLEGKKIEVGSTKELANNIITENFGNKFKKQRTENMANILDTLINNKNEEKDTQFIKKKTEIKSKDTVRKICILLYDKKIITKRNVQGKDLWMFVS